jgi:hypothetical protein
MRKLLHRLGIHQWDWVAYCDMFLSKSLYRCRICGKERVREWVA